MKFSFFHLCVEDLEGMAAWYRDVVGLKQNFDLDVFKGFVTEDGFFFNMSKRSDEHNGTYPQGRNGTMNLGFCVPTHKNVDIEYERLIKAGAIAIEPPITTSWGHRDAYVADPEGNIICINSATE